MPTPGTGKRGHGGITVINPSPSTIFGFPQRWMYLGTDGLGNGKIGDAGYPGTTGGVFMTAPGVFDPSTVQALAKFALATVNISPFTNTDHPENLGFLSQLRSLNPGQTILWYATHLQMFSFATPNSHWKEEWDLATGVDNGTDRRLWAQNGNSFPYGTPTNCWWNTAKDNAANLLIALWRKYTDNKGTQGYFFDYAVSRLGNPSAPPNGPVDFVRAGYIDRPSLEAAIFAANNIVWAGLKPYGQVYGNRGGASVDADSTSWKGELIEGWDRDQGAGGSSPPGFVFADFDSAIAWGMQWQPTNPLDDNTILLKAETGTTANATTHNAAWNKLCRYTLASACILGGKAYIGNNRDTADVFRTADEFAVNASGTTDPGLNMSNLYYLGRPIEAGHKDAGGLWIRKFEKGIVLVNGDTSLAHSFTLDKTYRRINGVYDTVVNNGALISGSVSVPTKDGRFFLNQ